MTAVASPDEHNRGLPEALQEIADSLTARRCTDPIPSVQRSLFIVLVSDALQPSGCAPLDTLAPGWREELALLSKQERCLLQAFASKEGASRTARLASVFESLLAANLIRLQAPAIQLRSSRCWTSPSELLKVPPAERSAALRRNVGLDAATARSLRAPLAQANSCEQVLKLLLPGASGPLRSAGDWVLQPSSARRSSGSHYTPTKLSRFVVERCLGPVVEPRVTSGDLQGLLKLRVLDPSMGAGAFLESALEYLCDAARRAAPNRPLPSRYRAQIASQVLHGVDVDPGAVLLAQLTLLQAAPDADAAALKQSLVQGDALRENPHAGILFDGVIGNPPWVAYVGRAAQPLSESSAEFYKARFKGFRRYRTLHGLFIERSARWLSPGGRLGLVVPTSTADLAGYTPVREAHDELCEPEQELPDFGDGAFFGVFQPCMAVLSTRRRESASSAGAPWSLARPDLSRSATRLLERLASLPRMPRATFGERGYQTRPADRERLTPVDGELADGQVALLTGSEVLEFRTLPPRLCVKPAELQVALRGADTWAQVDVLIRQTARIPIASPAGGLAFRNSIIAGFASKELPAALLLGWLNCDVIRWFHFQTQRDARQGMPQLKVGHLRALPRPPAAIASATGPFIALSADVVERGTGLDGNSRAVLNRLAYTALGLDETERMLVSRWAEANPPPAPRARTLQKAADWIALRQGG